MSHKQQYLIVVSIILLFFLVVGCAEFQTKIDLMKSEQQLICKPPDVSLCAGWKV
mgnify:CR=1 FL=1